MSGRQRNDAAILVVCTGNVCRSPMVEALLRHHLRANGVTAAVSSAGTVGWNSGGATDHTLTALAERGVALDGHVSRRLNGRLIAPASLVLAMTNNHADAVAVHHPEAAPRTFVLGQLVRLGERHGPRGSESIAAWVTAVDALRDPARRRALPRDEIADPLGEPLEAYRLLAAALDDLTRRLARLLSGARAPERDLPADSAARVGHNGAS